MNVGLATGLATAVAEFLAHKRALGRKYLTEEATLRLLLAFAERRGVAQARRSIECTMTVSPSRSRHRDDAGAAADPGMCSGRCCTRRRTAPRVVATSRNNPPALCGCSPASGG